MNQIKIGARFVSILTVAMLASTTLLFAGTAVKTKTQKDSRSTTATAGSFPSVVQIETKEKTGTGFFVNPNGILLTNQHVVSPAKNVIVRLSDGRTVPGYVIAEDAKLDLAAVKVDLANTPFLQFSDGSDLKLGLDVKISGSPEGLSNSLIRATISSVSRKTGEREFLQLDGNINHGMSGGPVMNRASDVIGVTVSRAEEAQGIGFAIKLPDILKFTEAHAIGVETKDAKHHFIPATATTNQPTEGFLETPRLAFVLSIASILMLISSIIFSRAVKNHRSRLVSSQNVIKFSGRQAKQETYDDVQITFQGGKR